MTEAQIKHMVSRFLAWKLPALFAPDGGISFEPFRNAGTPHEARNEPVGTNLLHAGQAEAMVRYMLQGLPSECAVCNGKKRLTLAADTCNPERTIDCPTCVGVPISSAVVTTPLRA